jgi:hypothetical protein
MKCSAAKTWLLGAKTTLDLPPAVLQHLHECLDCRLHHRRLLLLNQEVRGLLAPPEEPAARARFWEKFDQLPPRPNVPLQPSPLHSIRLKKIWYPVLGASAAALLVGLGVGLLLAPLNKTEPVESPSVTARAPQTDAEDRQVVVHALEHDLRLARTTAADERFLALAGLATELDKEAHRLADQGRMEDLAQVAGLYDRVVRNGVVLRSRSLSEKQRPAVTAVVQQFERMEREARRAADGALPALGDHLRILAVAARDGSQALTAEDKLLPPPVAPSVPPRSLLGALVSNGLLLAEEDDPLRRAQYCTDLSDRLVARILQASATGDTDQASQMGKYLGQIMELGVVYNLENVSPLELEGPRRQEWERIGERAAQATDALERNLDQAPEAAKPVLEKALEAADQGRAQAKTEYKGPKGKGKLPPGLEKKLMRGQPLPPGIEKKIQRP